MPISPSVGPSRLLPRLDAAASEDERLIHMQDTVNELPDSSSSGE